MTAPLRQSSARHRHAERAGRLAERIAAVFLFLKGFRIMARRFRSGRGEIDLIARRGSLLIFVEVKARGSLDEAVFAVTPANRSRIEAAARTFIARQPTLMAADIRYDIIAISGFRLRHLPDAWREGG